MEWQRADSAAGGVPPGSAAAASGGGSAAAAGSAAAPAPAAGPVRFQLKQRALPVPAVQLQDDPTASSASSHTVRNQQRKESDSPLASKDDGHHEERQHRHRHRSRSHSRDHSKHRSKHHRKHRSKHRSKHRHHSHRRDEDAHTEDRERERERHHRRHHRRRSRSRSRSPRSPGSNPASSSSRRRSRTPPRSAPSCAPNLSHPTDALLEAPQRFNATFSAPQPSAAAAASASATSSATVMHTAADARHTPATTGRLAADANNSVVADERAAPLPNPSRWPLIVTGGGRGAEKFWGDTALRHGAQVCIWSFEGHRPCLPDVHQGSGEQAGDDGQHRGDSEDGSDGDSDGNDGVGEDKRDQAVEGGGSQHDPSGNGATPPLPAAAADVPDASVSLRLMKALDRADADRALEAAARNRRQELPDGRHASREHVRNLLRRHACLARSVQALFAVGCFTAARRSHGDTGVDGGTGWACQLFADRMAQLSARQLEADGAAARRRGTPIPEYDMPLWVYAQREGTVSWWQCNFKARPGMEPAHGYFWTRCPATSDLFGSFRAIGCVGSHRLKFGFRAIQRLFQQHSDELTSSSMPPKR